MAEITDLESKIIKQVEYYFGDVNLGRDKFMQEQRKLNDGWIPMQIMLKFNRLKQLSDSEEAIVNALKKASSGLVEVSKEGEKIRRSLDKPLPAFTKEVAQEVAERSVYVKGFPSEMKLEEGMEFFEKYGGVDQVTLRKAPNKKFKGSCFVTFKTKEAAVKFMTSEGVKYRDDLEMIKFYREDYFKQKNDATQKNDAKKKAQKKDKETDMVKSKMVVGSILKVDGLGAETKMEKVKKEFEKYGRVQWVDLDDDKKQAKLRFSEANEAKLVLDKMTETSERGVVMVDGQEVKCAILEGDEEVGHWREVLKMRTQLLNKRKKSGRDGHKAKKSRRG